MFLLPAYPSTVIKDPTGAGDSFAGGFLGYVAEVRRGDFETLKTAVAYGTVLASFTIAEFSLAGLQSISRDDIEGRLEELRQLTEF
jgi:sugar/nucleoside kinase (ribokinase family)